MERVGERFARGLKDYLSGFGGAELAVEPKAGETMAYRDWRAASASELFFQYRVPQRKLAIDLTVPLPMLLSMLDIFYGGSGAQVELRDELTSAERRFAERVGERLAAVLSGAWSTVLPMQPSLSAVALAEGAANLCPGAEPVLVQSFALSGAPFAGAKLRVAYPLGALRSLLGQCVEGGKADSEDAAWSAAINAAALNVRLPVRTIFARPEISFSRLLSLQPGDIIPLLLPQHVPITVAGRHFAHGSIGEANGRAAIRIEKMKEGFAP